MENAMTDEQKELLPCPFCGSDEQVRTGAIWPEYTFARVGCWRCGVFMEKAWTPEEAIAAWNTRTTPPSPDLREVEHGYTCDASRCLDDAFKAYQRVIVQHCVDPTAAEVFAIRANSEARKQMKRIGRQPARFGGD